MTGPPQLAGGGEIRRSRYPVMVMVMVMVEAFQAFGFRLPPTIRSQ
jgi:hypothetical protein